MLMHHSVDTHLQVIGIHRACIIYGQIDCKCISYYLPSCFFDFLVDSFGFSNVYFADHLAHATLIDVVSAGFSQSHLLTGVAVRALRRRSLISPCLRTDPEHTSQTQVLFVKFPMPNRALKIQYFPAISWHKRRGTRIVGQACNPFIVLSEVIHLIYIGRSWNELVTTVYLRMYLHEQQHTSRCFQTF